jgi:hypothetical protein
MEIYGRKVEFLLKIQFFIYFLIIYLIKNETKNSEYW